MLPILVIDVLCSSFPLEKLVTLILPIVSTPFNNLIYLRLELLLGL